MFGSLLVFTLIMVDLRHVFPIFIFHILVIFVELAHTNDLSLQCPSCIIVFNVFKFSELELLGSWGVAEAEVGFLRLGVCLS